MRNIFLALSLFAFGAVAGAASGDLFVEVTENAQLTGAQAACYATCAINAGAWHGTVANMRQACASRGRDGKFEANTRGVKQVAPNGVTWPATIEGRVP